MRDLLGWNVSLGRWAGVQVRLHFFFLVFAVLALNPQFDQAGPAFGALALGLLFVSVLLHELGHCVAAVRMGGRAEQIVLWPFGGLTQATVPHEPRAELLTSFSGPLANLFVCVLILLPLVIWGGVPVETGGMLSFDPLTPPTSPDGAITWQLVAGLAFWINWMLFLINLLLPATPLDGGRVLRSALWPLVGYRHAALQVAWAARITGVVLCLAGWFISTRPEENGASFEYAWVPMSLLGVFLFFSAQQDADRIREGDRDDAAFGYDFSQGYTSLERSFETSRSGGPSAMKQWFDRRREAKLERQRQQEEDEDRRVDEVLARLHEHGPAGISPEDRALLDRVSARYRNRETG